MIPRHYQQAAHDAAWQYLSSQSGEPLIVLPTGAGKSLVIAMMVEQARKFDARVIVLQHRKELIEQNAEKIQILLPDIRIGIYSAGLNSRDTEADVVCAGIQSVHSKAHEFGRRELILIDEVHLVGFNDDSMYGKFLADIRAINPRARMLGLTATPYRTGEGSICGADKMFHHICHESQTGDLISEGFLCNIINNPADGMVDTSGIKKRGGEFITSDAEKAFNNADKVHVACMEIVKKCRDRHSILCFAQGVNHAENIADKLIDITGERVGIVTGESMPLERLTALRDFKAGELRWLVNCDVLTTGFDAPCIDAIAILRATMSPGLFAQIVGRGLRKHESKQDSLILDFGENIKRHGSLDMPGYGMGTGQKQCRKCAKFSTIAARECHECGTVFPPAGMKACPECDGFEKNGKMTCHRCGYEWPSKNCPNCNSVCDPDDTLCEDCGFVFPTPKPRELRHDINFDDKSKLTGTPDPETWEVIGCAWGVHVKKANDSRTLRVDYTVRLLEAEGNLAQKTISEWVCFEHSGFARIKAVKWWAARSTHDIPDTIDDAVSYLDRHVARMPSQITTQAEGKFSRITTVDFTDLRPEESDWLEVACVEQPDGEYEYFDEPPF